MCNFEDICFIKTFSSAAAVVTTLVNKVKMNAYICCSLCRKYYYL